MNTSIALLLDLSFQSIEPIKSIINLFGIFSIFCIWVLYALDTEANTGQIDRSPARRPTEQMLVIRAWPIWVVFILLHWRILWFLQRPFY
jgi:hypothetical protein